jgi:inosine-uridine nucleoside N-ribohydrolase
MTQTLDQHPWLARAAGNPVVLDSDADNEIDDHFAVAWALAAAGLDLVALHAAPFANNRSSDAEAGMVQSAEQLRRLTAAAGRDVPVYEGSAGYLDTVADRRPAAVRDLLQRAGSGPVTVIAIGAITNIALALQADPTIAGRLSVVWLGGQPLWSDDPVEFNFSSDPAATRIVLESEVDLLLVPCRGVAELLFTSYAELQASLGTSAVGTHLLDVYRDQNVLTPGLARPIWDMAAVACLLRPGAVQVSDVDIPLLDDTAHWVAGSTNRSIPVVQWLDRNQIFIDFFARLRG